MPTPEQMLAGLARIANQWTDLAVIWHIVVALATTALVVGWRPSKRVGAALLSVPLVSVCILAFVENNPFHGALFGAASLMLGALAVRMPAGPVLRGVVWSQMIGLAMIGYAWVYPQFVEGANWAIYLYAAPLGLLPSPTTALVIGFGLLAGGFGDRVWSGGLGLLGLVYAVFGVFVLGVTLDIGLLVGACALLTTVFVPSQRRPDWSESDVAGAPSATGQKAI